MNIGVFRAQGNYIMEQDDTSLSHYALKIFCRGDGNERRTPDEAAKVAAWAAAALNFHDQNVDRIIELECTLANTRRVNEALFQTCELWLGAIQNSMSLRLALAGLPEGAGAVLVELLQDALDRARGEADDANNC